jgi:Mg2+/citrate symporter
MAKSRRALLWLIPSLAGGALFGLGRALLSLVIDPAHDDLLYQFIAGFVFGAVFGPLLAWMNRREHAALGPLSRSQKRRARKAARRGPAPADPEIRRAAHRLAISQRDYSRAIRIPLMVFSVLLVVVVLVLSILMSDWSKAVIFVGGAVLIGGVLTGVVLWMPGHWQRRADRLSEPEEQESRNTAGCP